MSVLLISGLKIMVISSEFKSVILRTFREQAVLKTSVMFLDAEFRRE
jgi:hypothetical protein